jgi:hypothetical protein
MIRKFIVSAILTLSTLQAFAQSGALDPTQLYVVTIRSTVAGDVTPLRQQGFLTDTTNYLSLNIFFDTDQSGVVVPGSTAKIAVSPFSMTKQSNGAIALREEKIDGSFITRGDIRRIRYEYASVEDTAANETTRGLKTFLSFLTPINALFNIGPTTFFGKLAPQATNINTALNELTASRSANINNVISTPLTISKKGMRTFTISSPISETTITIKPLGPLTTALNNSSLYSQLNSTLDAIATAKVDGRPPTCGEIASGIGLEYAGLSLADKAVMLGYVGTRRSPESVVGKLDCVGEDLVQQPDIQTALIGARYNSGLVRQRIDRVAIDEYLRRRETGDFLETLAAEFSAAAEASPADRPARIAVAARNFDQSVAVNDLTRTLGLATPSANSHELVEGLVRSGLVWLGCNSTQIPRPRYHLFIAGLPREPRSGSDAAPATSYPLSDVRGIQLALLNKDGRKVISSLLVTQAAPQMTGFFGQKCNPNAKPIAAN